jgi:choline dehydrogenase-like flavoprotein
MMKKEGFDVIVIGSGAGGGASAWALASRGFRVCLLEAGPAYDPFSDYRLDEANWEQLDFPDRAKHRARYTYGPMQEIDPRREELLSWNHIYGRVNDTGVRRVDGYHYMRGVGGSTLVFAGEAHRIHPGSMKMHSRFGLGADWPIDYRELELYYGIAERVVGVAGPSDDPARPRNEPYPLPPHPISYASGRVKDGCRALGLRLEPNPVAILSAPYDDRPECNYCANCTRGCPMTDKGSADVTFIRKAVATGNLTVRTDCRVTRLEGGPDDRVIAVEYVESQGRAAAVSGRAVVVSCGAIETPRLLLASENRHAPEGVGNEEGQVGKHFMETLYLLTSGLHPEPLGSYRGIPVDTVCWDYNAPDSIPGVIGGCRFGVATPEAEFTGPMNYAQRVVKGWGRKHKEGMRRAFGRVLTIGAVGESLPNKRSFVDLDPGERDEFGVPVARIHSFIDDMAARRLEFMAKKSIEILETSGVESIFEVSGSYDHFSSTHVFGTCRMGDDPRLSVVDKNGRSHRWRNLFIADASIFPSTGGGESPSLTIEALAIRTAHHMRELAEKGEL